MDWSTTTRRARRQGFLEILKFFKEESDRGAALVGDALIADTLKELVRAKLINDASVVKTLLEYPGPLSSHASRNHLAYAAGWIDELFYTDAKTLHKIS